MEFTGMLTFFEAGQDDNGIRDRFTRVVPTVIELGSKNQAVAGFEQETLIVDIVFELPAQAEDKLMPGVEHAMRAAAAASFEGQHEWFNAANERFPTQSFPQAAHKWSAHSFTGFAENNLAARRVLAEKSEENV